MQKHQKCSKKLRELEPGSSSKESEKRLPRSKLEYATIAQDFETVLCVAYHHYPGFFIRAGLFESRLTLTQG